MHGVGGRLTDEASGSLHGSLRASDSKENLALSPAEPNKGGGGDAVAAASANGEGTEGLGARAVSHSSPLRSETTSAAVSK